MLRIYYKVKQFKNIKNILHCEKLDKVFGDRLFYLNAPMEIQNALRKFVLLKQRYISVKVFSLISQNWSVSSN